MKSRIELNAREVGYVKTIFRPGPGRSNGGRSMFFVGIHQPADARNFDACFISVNRMRTRKGRLPVNDWIMDSGAFTVLAKHGHYPETPAAYANEIRRWKSSGNLLAAVTQDYMCEEFMLAKTGLTIAEHQRLTIERYDALVAEDTGVYIMPVLQGFAPADYVEHVRQYGARLAQGAWVGVGSVCKRNGDPSAILDVLEAIMDERPDLKLHGFGLKTTALSCPAIVDLLETADSMSWSFAARRQGRNQNDWTEGKKFARHIQVSHAIACYEDYYSRDGEDD